MSTDSDGTVESITINGKTFTTAELARRRERNRAKRHRRALRSPEWRRTYLRAVKAEQALAKTRDELAQSEARRGKLLAKVRHLEAEAAKRT